MSFSITNSLDDSRPFGHAVIIPHAQRVAITGGIACGKSVFARFLSDLGCEVIDADDVVHRLEAPGGCAVPLISKAFGPAVIGADGGVDRGALGRLVFAEPRERERLNALVHPLVRAELDAWFQRRGGGAARFAVIPLLFEVGWRDAWDMIVCVACRAEEQARRLRGRGLTDEESARRLRAQWPVAEKARLADRVIWNDGSLEMLRREAERLVRDLSEKQV